MLTALLWQGGAILLYAEEVGPDEDVLLYAEETGPDEDVLLYAEEVGPDENVLRSDQRAQIMADMSLEDKVAQMLIPSVRTWNGEDVTDLAAAPDLADALQKHPYGGLILFDSNIKSPEQAAALTAALQENNKNAGAATAYFMTVDAEGGLVMRLAGGTRMPGNMAIGAAGDWARFDAFASGYIIGEELHALGFNVNFAPDIDVMSDPANPVIGVRAFSDDSEAVALLGTCYGNGLAASGVIATYKHFPGHGDTGVDSHFDLPSIGKSYEQLKALELVPFQAAVDAGADMIMTAHITFPKIDEPVTLADGSDGYYPATMSRKILTDILRADMGYGGLIITDGMEMEAIAGTGLVPGSGVDFNVNAAEKAINAGADLLLIPRDLNDADAAAFYDAYIEGIVRKVEEGAIEESRIDEAVTRILTVKQKYGILPLDSDEAEAAPSEAAEDDSAEDDSGAAAIACVGSDEHHAIEEKITQHGITLVKNEKTLPLLPAEGDHGVSNVVILSRSEAEAGAIDAQITALREQGVIGDGVSVTTGTYYDRDAQAFAFDETCLTACGDADAVIVFTATTGLASLHDQSAQSQAIAQAKAAMPDGCKLILASGVLPYDAARYQEADAIVLAYMGAALDADPTGSAVNISSHYNANTAATLDMVFGAASPQGRLPVNIPALEAGGDGSYSYTEEVLYERGAGLEY